MSNADWGAIPRQLAEDVSNIIKKKMGTSSGYKPVEWKEQINLMGKLPERTVSGSVVAFSDGADDVPLKSCAVTIAPTLDGVSSVGVVQTGKNLIDNSADSWENNGIDYQTGQNATSATKKRTVGFYPIKGYANIVVSGVPVSSGSSDFRFFWYDKNKSYLGYRNMPPVPYAVGYQAACYFRLAIDREIDISALQIEYAETTATTYAPYVEPTTHTANLGRTIFGGTPDVVNGTGKSSYVILSLAVADMNNSEDYPGWRNCGIRAIIGAEVSTSITDGVSTVGQYWSYNTLGNNDIIYLPKGRYNNMNQTDWKTTYPDLVIQFAIQLPTPEDFTFTPVPILSRLGDNTMWSDGDLSVTYRRDIDLALNQ